jgi:PAS domain-containing protein
VNRIRHPHNLWLEASATRESAKTGALERPTQAPHRRAARRAIDGLELELLDLVQDAVIVRGLRDPTIPYWNHGAEVLYGWTKEEAIGRVAHELECTPVRTSFILRH